MFSLGSGRKIGGLAIMLPLALLTRLGQAADHTLISADALEAREAAAVIKLPPNAHAPSQVWTETNAVANATVSRIVKSLGCVVDARDKDKTLHDTLSVWGAKFNGLGAEAAPMNTHSSYSAYVRALVDQYLGDPRACGSDQSICYLTLQKPLFTLVDILRTKDLGDEKVRDEVKVLETRLNRLVKYLRSFSTRPYCRLDHEVAVRDVVRANPAPLPAERRPILTPPPVVTAPPVPLVTTPTPAPALPPTPVSPTVVVTPTGPAPAPVTAATHGNARRLTTNVGGERPANLPANRSQLSTDLAPIAKALAEAGANAAGVQKALDFYAHNQWRFKNQRYLTFIDYTQSALHSRMYVIDTQTLQIQRFKVAHGSGSGPAAGTPTRFSNAHGSDASSVGAYYVAEIDNDPRHRSERKYRIWLDGLESTDSEVRDRGVYMHEAWYVPVGGRSHGCPAMTQDDILRVQPLISGGSFMYIYSDRV